MAIEWLAGNRLRGTTAERPNFGLASGSLAGWKEVGRHTLDSSGQDVDVNSLPDKRYYMVLFDHNNGDGSQPDGRFNNSTGNEYRFRYNNDGSEGVNGSLGANMKTANGWNTSEFDVAYIVNKSNKGKLMYFLACSNRGGQAGTAPSRTKTVNHWTNTSDAISSINYGNGGGGASAFPAGTECVVLGYDPADTHTDNFWQELASESQSSSGEMTVSFTAKKYIWIQYECTSLNPTATGLSVRFNSDDTSKYCRRFSQDGASDVSNQVNQTKLSLIHSGGSHFFGNMFILNKASKEKFIIANQVAKKTANGGDDEAPRRWEIVGKWVNTSDQISSITFIDTEQGSSGISRGSIKIWGSD